MPTDAHPRRRVQLRLDVDGDDLDGALERVHELLTVIAEREAVRMDRARVSSSYGSVGVYALDVAPDAPAGDDYYAALRAWFADDKL